MEEIKLEDYETLDIEYYFKEGENKIDYIFNNCIKKESININKFFSLNETLEGINKYIMEYNHYLNYEYKNNIKIKLVEKSDNLYHCIEHKNKIYYRFYDNYNNINSYTYKFFEIKVDDEIYHYLFTIKFLEYELKKYFDIMFNKNLEKFSLKNKENHE